MMLVHCLNPSVLIRKRFNQEKTELLSQQKEVRLRYKESTRRAENVDKLT